MNITCIRHLPTKWNRAGKLQGLKDIPITAITKDLEKQIRQNLRKIYSCSRPDIVLASTLTRTRQTAEFYGFTPAVDELLNELSFGPFEGMEKSQFAKAAGKLWLTKPSASVLGKEVRNLEKRIKLFVQKYKLNNHVLLFGHGVWIRALLSLVYYGDIDRMNQLSVKNNDCIHIRRKQIVRFFNL